MIQSPGGGSACHGVSLFIWREYGLQDDGGAKKKEIKHLQKGKKKERSVLPLIVVSTRVFGWQTRFRRAWMWLHSKCCEIRKSGQKSIWSSRAGFVSIKAWQGFFYLFIYLFFFSVLRCRSRPQLVCVGRMCVFAQAPWLAESYFVSVEKVWDGMSGLCLTEHVCACVGGECV